MRKELDRIDRLILSVLQSEGRISVADLSERIGLSPTPSLRRLRSMESAGIISRYAAILDRNEVGFPINAFATIRLSRHPREEAMKLFSKEVLRWPEVVECHLMSGEMNYLLRIVAADLPAYNRFLKDRLGRLHYVASVKSSFSLEELKCTNALPLIAPGKT